MNDNAKIISRIRKLLAMANDTSSPHEAVIAAQRARSLMDKHQITMADLVESDGFGSSQAGNSRKFMARWEQSIAVAVAEYNDCNVRFVWSNDGGGKKVLQFEGFESDVQVAQYMFVYLVEVGKRACSEYMKEKGFTRYNAKVGTSFKNGFRVEVAGKLNTLLKEREANVKLSTGTSLVVQKKELVNQHFGAAKYRNSTTGCGDFDAWQKGCEVGRRTNITTGLNGGTDCCRLA